MTGDAADGDDDPDRPALDDRSRCDRSSSSLTVTASFAVSSRPSAWSTSRSVLRPAATAASPAGVPIRVRTGAAAAGGPGTAGAPSAGAAGRGTDGNTRVGSDPLSASGGGSGGGSGATSCLSAAWQQPRRPRRLTEHAIQAGHAAGGQRLVERQVADGSGGGAGRRGCGRRPLVEAAGIVRRGGQWAGSEHRHRIDVERAEGGGKGVGDRPGRALQFSRRVRAAHPAPDRPGRDDVRRRDPVTAGRNHLVRQRRTGSGQRIRAEDVDRHQNAQHHREGDHAGRRCVDRLGLRRHWSITDCRAHRHRQDDVVQGAPFVRRRMVVYHRRFPSEDDRTPVPEGYRNDPGACALRVPCAARPWCWVRRGRRSAGDRSGARPGRTASGGRSHPDGTIAPRSRPAAGAPSRWCAQSLARRGGAL